MVLLITVQHLWQERLQTFMISSIFGQMQEVVKLMPVRDMDTTQFLDAVLQVISFVQNAGFKILCLITDNNRVNQRLFKLLSNTVSFSNPQFHDELIFILYDPTHELKNYRNNWLNLKPPQQFFIFPDFDNHELREANFEHIRTVYRDEQNSLIKKAFRLNYNKTCYPTKLERQKVSLALNVFDESLLLQLYKVEIIAKVRGIF